MSLQSNIFLALLITFASSGFVQKYTGFTGVLFYAVLMTAAGCAISKWGRFIYPVISRWFTVLATASAALLITLFLVLNPWEDGKGPGKSSDRDEGLNMAVERVVSGVTPYYPPNTTAGPLSVLPGAMILAAPFVALGDSGYQNVFWIFAFFALAAWHFRDRCTGMTWIMIAVFTSAAVAYEYISGGDLIANGIYVPLSLALAIRLTGNPISRKGLVALSFVFVGVCLTSRSNLPFLVPLFAAAIWRVAGFRMAAVAFAITIGTIAALTLPLYLNDPAGFTPLMSRHKLAAIDHVIPHASWILVGCTAISGVVTACILLRNSDLDIPTRVFRHATVVMITPMILLVSMQSLANGRCDFSLMHDRFGLLYLFFAILGWGRHLFGNVATVSTPRITHSAL